MNFTPITRREEILYRELMDAQLEITKKNIEIANLKNQITDKNILKDMHEMNKKLIYESISHPLTD